jgi:predicted GNAT family acetyltransferase
VNVERLPDAQAFLDRTGAFLEGREALHNLTLGVVARVAASPRVYGDVPHYFGVAVADGRIVGCASRTAAVGAILSEVDDDEAPAALALDIRDAVGEIAGVVGPAAATELFARTWSEATGAVADVAVAQLIYEATSATPPTGVAGRPRLYADADRELVVGWLRAFVAEALPPDSAEDAREFLDRRLADPASTLLLWDDGGPVSLAVSGSPTPHGIRIGPVYTPPERRRRGYAAAVTAELTLRELEAGRRSCFLYTDVANATSNSVYRRIGYRVVGDAAQWRFHQRAGAQT